MKALAHDLNGRLGVLIGNAALLQMEELPPDAAGMVDDIAAAATEARWLVHHLLELCQQSP